MMAARSLPSLNALRAFEAVVRRGSVSLAADELHVTHGAISRHIHALEDELGCRLFQRKGRGLSPTSAGLRLAEAAGAAFTQLRDVCTRLRDDAAQAPLVLGCAASVMARWIIPRLAQLERDLPHLRLHLSPQENLPDAELAGMDAALLLAAPPWPASWVAHELAPERIGPVLAPHHPAAATLASAAPQAITQQLLLHTTSRPQAWPGWARRHDLDTAELRYGTGFAHLYYLLEAAVAGLGIAIAPEPLVREDIAAGRLIAPWGFVETEAHWVLCTRRGYADPRVQELAAWMTHALAAHAGSP